MMRIIASVVLGVVLLVGVCVYMQPMTSECPTKQVGVLCPMHDTDALSFWQQAIMLSRRVMELAAFVLVALFAWFVLARGRSDPESQRILFDRLYLSHLPFSYLQELFSQGILHPKVY